MLKSNCKTDSYLFAAHVSDDTIRILIGLTALIFVATTWLGPARPKPAQSGIVSAYFGERSPVFCRSPVKAADHLSRFLHASRDKPV
jgi:hypothetical protein